MQLLIFSRMDNPAQVVRRYDVERSCLRCHERKVRCDRGMPCTTCIRANTPCQYPGPGRIQRRSAQKSSQKVGVGTRLDMLERAITAIYRNSSPDQTSRSSPALPPTNTPRSAEPESAPTEGFLVRDGTSTRYVNELLFSRVLAKVGKPLPLTLAAS